MMNSAIKKFEFTIYIKDLKALDKCVEGRLFEAGCDDALLCSINKYQLKSKHVFITKTL